MSESLPPTSDEPEYLLTSEVAKKTRAPEATVRYWRSIGTGPRSFKVGRRVLYSANEVRSWMEQQANA